MTTNINLQFFFEFIPTESSAGETCLYIATKPHNDLNVYKVNQLEPIFC